MREVISGKSHSHDDFSMTYPLFGSKKRTVLLYILRNHSSYVKIIKTMRREFGLDISPSELYKHLETLRMMKAVIYDSHTWILTPFGNHMIKTLEFLNRGYKTLIGGDAPSKG